MIIVCLKKTVKTVGQSGIMGNNTAGEVNSKLT